jgi:hypothetical protein
MSTSKFCKVPNSTGLYRYGSQGVYYARWKNRGKLIVKKSNSGALRNAKLELSRLKEKHGKRKPKMLDAADLTALRRSRFLRLVGAAKRRRLEAARHFCPPAVLAADPDEILPGLAGLQKQAEESRAAEHFGQPIDEVPKGIAMLAQKVAGPAGIAVNPVHRLRVIDRNRPRMPDGILGIIVALHTLVLKPEEKIGALIRLPGSRASHP